MKTMEITKQLLLEKLEALRCGNNEALENEEKQKEIEKQKLWQKGKYKLYFTKINSVGWEFIEYRYNIATFEKTSIEILSSLKLTSINQNWIASLKKLFIISDLVKFAKQIPTEQENIFAIQTIREFIENERNDLLNTETKE